MLILTPQERESLLWEKILQQGRENVDRLHSRLENAKTWDEVLKIQGELRAIRAILNANNVPVRIDPETGF